MEVESNNIVKIQASDLFTIVFSIWYLGFSNLTKNMIMNTLYKKPNTKQSNLVK